MAAPPAPIGTFPPVRANEAPASASAVQQPADDSDSTGSGPLKEQKPLNVLSVACLIINKMIGTGIYTTPGIVLLLAGNKVLALFLWVFGGLYSYLSIYIYLEYGLAWPYNGGEFFYISKIFPRPPLLFACSFAWIFVAFSTSVGNALNFAKFLLLTRNPNPNEWLEKFIACGIVFAISILHYRTVNIGVDANNYLATGKVFFLSFLVVAGIIGVSRDGHNKELLGLADFSKTTGDVTAVNVVVAILLVFYSFQGWENANYVTSEIRGSPEKRKQILKSGALWAISIVTGLYIAFNFFLFFLLDFDTITKNGPEVAADFAIRALHGKDETTRQAIYVCIALSASGNLVGVIFTNIRVKRDIAKYRIIPFYRYFSKSSEYGHNTWDGLGTPTGGIMLHGLVTCITVAATPFFPGSTEGQTFVVNLYTYAHSILGIALGIGLPFLKKRMDENQTEVADEAGIDIERDFTYKFFKNSTWRWTASITFIVVNGFLIGVPFKSTNNTDGTPRKIPTWVLPIIILLMYLLGALVAIFILGWIPDNRLYFKGSNGPTEAEGWVDYNNRRWIIQWREIGRQPWETFKKRLFINGEKDEALRLRNRYSSSGGALQQALPLGPLAPGGPVQQQVNTSTTYSTGFAPTNGGPAQANIGAVQSNGGIPQPRGSNQPILPS